MTIFVRFNGETVKYTIKAPETIFRKWNTLWKSLNGELEGDVRLVYNWREDLWNEFHFNGKQDFKEKLRQCLEPELLAHVGAV